MAYVKKGTSNRSKVIIGQKFGRLTVIGDLGVVIHGGAKRTKVKTICECGNEHDVIYSDLKGGGINSCGCLRKEMAKIWGHERRYKHGLSKHPLMKIWAGITERCYNENNKYYHNYGARGVIMCEEWRNNFKSFYDWAISSGWKKGLEVDKDIKGNGLLYSPETCCISTKKENNRAKRNNINITYNGVTMCAMDWANKIGIEHGTLIYRLKNWGVERALTTPKNNNYDRRTKKC